MRLVAPSRSRKCSSVSQRRRFTTWPNRFFGLLFALSEFVVAWVIAFVYSKKANAQFDAMAQEIINDVDSGRI